MSKSKKENHPTSRFFPEDGFIRKNFDYGDSPYFGTPGGGAKSMKDYINKRRKRVKQKISLLNYSKAFLKLANEVAQPLVTDEKIKTVDAVVKSLMATINMKGTVTTKNYDVDTTVVSVQITTNYEYIDAYKFRNALYAAADAGKAGPDGSKLLRNAHIELFDKQGRLVKEEQEQKKSNNEKVAAVILDILVRLNYKNLLVAEVNVSGTQDFNNQNIKYAVTIKSKTDEATANKMNSGVIAVIRASIVNNNKLYVELFKNNNVSLINYYNGNNNVVLSEGF